MAWLSARHFCPGPPSHHGPGWCFYNYFKLAMTLPSIVASVVVGAMIWRRRKKLNKHDPRRTRTLADFFDKLVLILFCVDAVGSIPEFFYVFDTNASPLRYYNPSQDNAINTLVYVVLLEGQVMLNAIWHSYMSFVMFSFIVLRQSVSRLKRQHNPYKVLGLGLAFVVAYVLLYVGFFYYAKQGHAAAFKDMVIMAFALDIVIFSSCILFMLTMYFFTWRALKERSSEAAFLTGRYVRIRRKLMLITIVIGTTLLLGMIGDMLQWISRVDGDVDVPPHEAVAFVAVRITAFRSIGLFDALIFGGAFDTCLDRQALLGDGDVRNQLPTAAIEIAKGRWTAPGRQILGLVRALMSWRHSAGRLAPPSSDATGMDERPREHQREHQQQHEHHQQQQQQQQQQQRQWRRQCDRQESWQAEEWKEMESVTSLPEAAGPGDVEMGIRFPDDVAGQHGSGPFLHVAPVPCGAAGGLRHQSSVLPDNVVGLDEVDGGGCVPLQIADLAGLSSLSCNSRVAADAAYSMGPLLTSPEAVFTWSAPPSAMAKIKVFATTSNVGGCTELQDLGPLEEWVPLGFDLYVIGFQECLMLDALRVAIHDHLGGPGRYEGFVREIGDATILNGMIALTVFARTADVERGAVRVASSAQSRLHSGMKLGPIGRAPNKGLVGLSIRYHDVSIACCGAHLAADKHGKSRVAQRNRDTYRALRELTLTHDDWDFDAHLTHDVLLLLGDLNYRLTAEPQHVLQRVAQAAEGEQALWWRRGRPHKDWRTDRYRRLFFLHDSPATAAADDDSLCNRPLLMAPEHSIQEEEKDREVHVAEEEQGDEAKGRAAPQGERVGVGSGDGDAAPPEFPRPPDWFQRQRKHSAGSNGSGMGWSGGSGVYLASNLPVSGSYAMEEPPGQDSDEEGGGKGGQGNILRSHMSVSNAPSSSLVDVEAGNPWEWVRQYDELTLSMKQGHVFYNFHEAPIRFPPSYRWVPGTSGGSFQDPAALESCYTLKAHSKKSGWTVRPPSYTDRVLIHALPDVTPRLRILGYEMCDSITGSDHRPVSCSLEICVNSTILGFNEIPLPEARRQRQAAIAAAYRRPSPKAANRAPLFSPLSGSPAKDVRRQREQRKGWQQGSPVPSLDLPQPRRLSAQLAASHSSPLPTQARMREELAMAASTGSSSRPLAGGGGGVGDGLPVAPALPPRSKSISFSVGPTASLPSSDTVVTTTAPDAQLEAAAAASPSVATLPALCNTPSTPRRLSVLSWKSGGSGRGGGEKGRLTELMGQGHGQAPPHRLHQHSARWPVPSYDGPLAVWTVELTHLRLVGHEVDLPDMEELTVQFPISTEDPIGLERKSLVLDESFMDLKRGGSGSGAGASAASPRGAEGALASFLLQKQQLYAGSGYSTAFLASNTSTDAASALDVITSIHRISYRRMALQRDLEHNARGLSMTISAVVAPTFTRHLLVKLRDHKGRDIGQGAVSLKEACAVPPGDDLLVPLSLGGQPRYVFLALRCRVREEIAYHQRARGTSGGACTPRR